MLRGNIRGKGGFWVIRPNKFLAEGRPGFSDTTLAGMVRDAEFDQISHVGDFCLNKLKEILEIAKIDLEVQR